jgi:DNA-binding GntR family transcriptional regulator
VELLSQKIISGKIRPGERLNESSLAQQFRISRAPIREALQQLLEQGLVVNVPRRGMFVVSLSDEDVQKINSLRLILECEALRLARLNITAHGVQKLTALVKKMDLTEPAATDHSVRLDIEFHRTIWSFTGNEYLEKNLTSLTAPLFAHAMLIFLRADRQRLVLDSHRPLLDFVMGNSTQTAEEVMLAHLSLRWTEPSRFSSLRPGDGSSLRMSGITTRPDTL